jgi:hypothetical protein
MSSACTPTPGLVLREGKCSSNMSSFPAPGSIPGYWVGLRMAVETVTLVSGARRIGRRPIPEPVSFPGKMILRSRARSVQPAGTATSKPPAGARTTRPGGVTGPAGPLAGEALPELDLVDGHGVSLPSPNLTPGAGGRLHPGRVR